MKSVIKNANGPVTRKPRLLVGVCSCHGHAPLRAAARATWAGQVAERIRVVFFVGDGSESEAPDVWVLRCPDDYEALPLKTQTFLRRALGEDDWDYVFKCDDDTYVMLDRLAGLAGLGEFVGSADTAGAGFASGGGGYLLSRNAARAVVEAPVPAPGAEDVWVSRLLQQAGFKLVASPALQMNHAVLPNRENSIVTAHWCSEELLRLIHRALADPGALRAAHTFHATHAAWHGPVTLLEGGYFFGGSFRPDGRWEFEVGETWLRLQWFHWPEDRLVFTPLGFVNATLRLDRVPMEAAAGNGPQKKVARDPLAPSAEKLHLGAGGNPLPGWSNHDLDMDLRQPLPLPDASVRFLFAEHVVEHVTPREAWRFFKEVRRVLKPGGVLRLAVPCVDLIAERYDEAYADFLRRVTGGDGSKENAMDSIISNWGHQAVWTVPALRAVLHALGLKTTEGQSGVSAHPELHGIDGHARAIGAHANWVETGIVEAVKPALPI